MVRFAKEFAIYDTDFPLHFVIFSMGIFKVISTTIVILVINFWLIIVTVIAVSLFTFFFKLYERPVISIVKSDTR